VTLMPMAAFSSTQPRWAAEPAPTCHRRRRSDAFTGLLIKKGIAISMAAKVRDETTSAVAQRLPLRRAPLFIAAHGPREEQHDKQVLPRPNGLCSSLLPSKKSKKSRRTDQAWGSAALPRRSQRHADLVKIRTAGRPPNRVVLSRAHRLDDSVHDFQCLSCSLGFSFFKILLVSSHRICDMGQNRGDPSRSKITGSTSLMAVDRAGVG
jgi:hypothetical protein